MSAPNPVIVVIREWIAKAENDLKNASLALAAGADCPTKRERMTSRWPAPVPPIRPIFSSKSIESASR